MNTIPIEQNNEIASTANAEKQALTSTITIGLFGCGTVGSGVVRILQEQAATIAEQCGAVPVIQSICVLHPEKERSVDITGIAITSSAGDILDDPSIDIIIEVIGGEQEALGILTRALVAGKKVITANKLVVSRHLPMLRRLEDLHGGRLFYGAAVCGSVPILKVLDETLLTDRVHSIRGVVNGSTNFILSRLSSGLGWEDALNEARLLGFLEADPTADISGADAAQKLAILVYHAFGKHVSPDDIKTTGISESILAEVEAARCSGHKVKLVAEAIEVDGELQLIVEPRALPANSSLALVDNEVNIVEVECEGVGIQRFIGKGAGSIPTANAVVSDLLDVFGLRRYRRRAMLAAEPDTAGVHA